MSVDFEDLHKVMLTGSAEDVAGFFTGMSEKDRRRLVKPLREYLRSFAWRAIGQLRGDEYQQAVELRRTQWEPLLVAGIATISGAGAVGKWVRQVVRDVWGPDFPQEAMLRAALERNPDWLAELPDALCDALVEPGAREWQLVNAFAEAAGVKPQPSDNYVLGWASSRSALIADTKSGGEALDDPLTLELAPRLFEIDAADRYFRSWARWLRTALLERAADDPMLREELLDGSLNRLLRGGRQGAVRGHLAFWVDLKPTDIDIAARATTCISLLSAEAGTVAARMYEDLRRVFDAGLLDLELVLEAASLTVVRPEKKLVRAALGWLDVLAKSRPERTGEIAAAVASAFGSTAGDIQERALTILARHLKALTDDDCARLLSDAQLLLPPDLVERAAALFGGSAAPDELPPYPEIAAFIPSRLPEPIGSAAELAEEVSVLLRREPEDGMAVERVLAAFVAFAADDPAALREALAPVVSQAPSSVEWEVRRQGRSPRSALYCLAAVVATGQAGWTKPPGFDVLWRFVCKGPEVLRHGSDGVSWSPADVLSLRISELAATIVTAPVPFLLATPTAANGLVDPRVLADRLRRAEAEGWEPLVVDAEQALLRLPADCGEVDGDADGFTSPAGRAFAAWISGDRPTLPGVRRERDTAHFSSNGRPSRPQLRTDSGPADGSDPASLVELLTHACDHPQTNYSDWTACWPAILPSAPDLVACAFANFIGGDWFDVQVRETALARLAEADSGDHLGLHSLVADALLDTRASFRAGAVDTALVLAARGALNGERLGTYLAESLRTADPAGLRYLVPGLRDLTNGGAAEQTWTVVERLLVGTLPPAVPRTLSSTADLLALATELASGLGGREPIAEVTALAERKTGSAVGKAARRLASVLTADPAPLLV